MACLGKSGSGSLSETELIFTAKIIFTAAFGLLFVFSSFAQTKGQENYSIIFQDDYQRAEIFLKNEKSISRQIELHGLKVKEVTAIIFPELIRYNSIQDKIETFALESLYVQYGKDYANFSVGEFQIKPSFAEAIEIDFLENFGEKKLSEEFGIQLSDTIQNHENRSKRLRRMQDRLGMVNYLCMFTKLMNKKYPSFENEERQIKFYAAAYNCGYYKSKAEIKSFETKKFFYTGIMAMKKYCYADVAWYFFHQP